MSAFLASGISSPQEIAVVIFIGLIFTVGCIFLSLRVAAKGRKQLIHTVHATNQALQTLVGAFSLRWVEPLRPTSSNLHAPASPTLGKVTGCYRDMSIEIGIEGDSDEDYRLVFSLKAAPGKQFKTKIPKPPWAYIFHATPSQITMVPRVSLMTTWSGESYRIISDAAELQKMLTTFGDLANDLLVEA